MVNINVLILEDEFIIFTHLKKLLKNIGFTNIYIAKTYSQALELASQHTIHILLSDINIDGEVDGIETAKVLQKLYTLAVVFITAYNDDETLKRAAKVDFMGYLLKPYREDELRTLISLIIRKYHFCQSALLKVSGKYIFDMEEQSLYKDAKHIKLSEKEKKFFQLVFNNLRSIITYEMIDEVVWSHEPVSDNTRRTFIYRVKQKFQDLEMQTIKDMGIQVS